MKMTPAESITATTINAAYSLKLGDEIGSLETGKRADFVIHDCAAAREPGLTVRYRTRTRGRFGWRMCFLSDGRAQPFVSA